MPIRMTGLNSGLDTEAIIEELMAAQKMKLTKIENKQTKLEWQQEKWKELNTKLYSLYTEKLSPLRLQSSYQLKKVTSSRESVVTASGNANAVNGTHSIQVKQLASAQYVTGAKIATTPMGEEVKASTTLADLGYAIGDTITFTTGTDENGQPITTTLDIEGDTTIADLVKKAKDAGLNANFDATQKRLYISAKEGGRENSFEISTTATVGMEALGLGTAASVIEGKEAIFRYNGVEYTSNNNAMEINGLTFQLTGTTANYDDEANAESVSITVDNDVDAAYNMVKDFITSYNEILKEMNELYYAESARGYEPLTDEEKEAMTEDQVEKWEKKIKDALLRNDSSLGGVITGMKSALAKTVSVNGQNYSLSTFGIMTSTDYKEKGLLHIYGNKEDATYAGKEDKLKSAFLNDPEGAVNALSQIFDGLYQEMTKRMSATSLSSALTFYNDKQLTKLEKQYKDEYTEMENRLQKIEDRYYDQFTAMESAMANLNSQQSAMAGLFGTGA